MIVFVAGYKGWGCTDESEAVSEIDLLAATLLLCLSNLLYLPAVGLAIYRGFYTESFVYFANMIASTVCILHTKIHSVWKFRNFSTTQTFREINFEDSRNAKSAILTHQKPPNFDFNKFLYFLKAEIYPNIKTQSP